MSLEASPLARLPWPVPWSNYFGRDAPLMIEIGFGGGHFLVDIARRRPDWNVLGIEISLPSLRRGLKKAEILDLKNVRIIQGDSRSALWMLVEPQTIGGVYINFPDPWPKAAHQHRRLINDEFLHLLATRMKNESLLSIATDHQEYAAVIADCLERSPHFDSIFDTTFVTKDRDRTPTKYELIALNEGRPCHYFKWIRNSEPAANLFPLMEEYPVPHVVINTPLMLEEIFETFRPFHSQVQSIHVSYMDIYHSWREQKLLVEVFIHEDPFQQRLGVTIRRRKMGDFVISLHELGFPRPTIGAHLAVYFLVEWLKDLSSETTIANSTLNVSTMDIGSGGG